VGAWVITFDSAGADTETVSSSSLLLHVVALPSLLPAFLSWSYNLLALHESGFKHRRTVIEDKKKQKAGLEYALSDGISFPPYYTVHDLGQVSSSSYFVLLFRGVLRARMGVTSRATLTFIEADSHEGDS